MPVAPGVSTWGWIALRGVGPRVKRGACLASALVVVAVLAAVVPAVAVPPGFVTRQGTQLQLESGPYRFTGFNVYYANSDGTCGPAFGSGPELGDAIREMGPGGQVIRAWFFQSMATDGDVRDWSAFDHTLSVAASHGVKVVVTLANQWQDCESAAGYKDETWYEIGYTQPDPGGIVSYRDWVAEVVDRYRDDSTVLAWQLMNEAEVKPTMGGECSANAAGTLKDFATDVSELVKSIDQDHLVSLGTIGGGQCGAQGPDYQDLHSISTVDLCEYHDYGDPSAIPGDQFNGLQVRIDQCNALNKPLFVGEVGIIPNDVGGTLEARASVLEDKLFAQLGAGVDGALVWSWSSLGSTLDNFDVGPGDPVLDVLARVFAADLALTKTDPPGRVPTGRNMTYTLSVVNNGADQATGVTVTDQLPSSVTFVSAIASQGSCGETGGIVTCDVGSMPSGGTATVDIVVRPTIAGTIINTASVTASTPDPNMDNNSDSEDTSVCRVTSRRSSIPCG